MPLLPKASQSPGVSTLATFMGYLFFCFLLLFSANAVFSISPTSFDLISNNCNLDFGCFTGQAMHAAS